jgi:hypothetical protein
MLFLGGYPSSTVLISRALILSLFLHSTLSPFKLAAAQ